MDSHPFKKIKVIDSSANASYKLWKSLTENAGIKRRGLCLISGRKIVPEILRSWSSMVRTLIITSAEELTGLDWPRRTEVIQLKKTLFSELDVSGTNFPLVVCTAPTLKQADLAEKPWGLELVLALSDPRNLGAILRSAEAFNASRVILLKECANPFLPKVLRASSGSSLRVPLALGPSIQDLTPAAVTNMIGLSGKADLPLDQFSWPKNVRLLLGEEGQGLPSHLKLKTLSIPMNKKLDSLNATVAASIFLYKYFENFRAPR